MNELVTIYIPTKNRLVLLKRAVQSVMAQTYRPIELIIVSDGATDGTCEYIRSLHADTDIDIKLIHNDKSVGACEARNQALNAASGDYITGLDDDDLFLPHRVTQFVAEWQRRERNNEAFSCLFDRRIVDYGTKVMLVNLDTSVTAEQLVTENSVGNQVFCTPQRMLAAGGFDCAMPAWQDWELWMRLLERHGPAYSISANSYVMDVSHEFERITLKSPEKITEAARLFYEKHGHNREQQRGVLASLMGYEQIRMTLRDLFLLLRSPHYFRSAARQLRHRRFRWSWSYSLS